MPIIRLDSKIHYAQESDTLQEQPSNQWIFRSLARSPLQIFSGDKVVHTNRV
jgi:hypothetical protein